jgi:iron complex outermembrane receptor protein
VETGFVPGLDLEVALPGLLGVAAVLDARQTDNAAMGMASLQFLYKENITTFVTASRGYKGAGIEFTARSVDVLDPETPFNIEAGIRANLLDSRLYLSVTGFHTDYGDFQSSVDALGGALTTNINNVRSRGFELEAVSYPNDRLSLNFSLAYVDATIEDFDVPVNCYPDQSPSQGCIEISPDVYAQSIEGNHLPNAPEWGANLGASYTFYRSFEGEGYVTGNYSWRDDALFDLGGDPGTTQESYGLLNARVGYSHANSGLEISLWSKNVLDKNYSYVIFENVIFSGGYSQFIGMERQFGADVKWGF